MGSAEPPLRIPWSFYKTVTTRSRYVNLLVIVVSFARGTRRVHSLTRRVGSRLRARVSRGLGESISWTRRVHPSGWNPKSPGCPLFKPPYSPILASLTLRAQWENPNPPLRAYKWFGAILWRWEEGEEERSKESSCSAKIQGQIWVYWGIFGVPFLLYALIFH